MSPIEKWADEREGCRSLPWQAMRPWQAFVECYDPLVQIRAALDNAHIEHSGLSSIERIRMVIQDRNDAQEIAIKKSAQEKAVQQRIEKLEAVRDDIRELANDDDPHDMGGPFIDINWILRRLNAALEDK